MAKFGFVCLILLAAAVVSCSSLRQFDTTSGVNNPSGDAQKSPAPVASTQQQVIEYRIGTSDRLEISVLQYPELTKQVIVRPDGIISLPLIGEVAAGGLKPTELERLLSERYVEYLRSPSVTVNVLDAKSFEVLIRGEVSRPGAYPYKQGMTLLDLLTTAGDFTIYADKNDVTIIRGSGSNRKIIKAKLKNPEDLYTPLYIEPGDIVVIGD
ncbi:MAG: polysaccharide biosynthesis/export family protein [Deltaproteobacteria bacterium]